MSTISKDIIAKCPQCLKYAKWLMSERPVRVVETEPEDRSGQRWVNHPCDVAHLYDPNKTYRFDMWGRGREVIPGEWLP